MGSSTKPLVPYIRQSRSKEVTISLDEQRRAIEAWAAVNGRDLAEPIVEQGVSGNKHWSKRELGQAIHLCQEGRASGIIVYDQSRLTREGYLGTAEVWTAIYDAGCRIVESTGGEIDRTKYVIMAEMNRLAWEQYERRGKDARRNAIERGVHIGPRPLGYRKVKDKHGKSQPLEINPDEAPIVQAAFEARAGGGSWTDAAAILTEGTGKPWSLKATSKLLANRTYLGEVRSGKLTPNSHAHPALISPRLFKRVQDSRESRERHKTRELGLLSGVIFCAACGHRLSQDCTKRSDLRTDFYRCGNQGACKARATVTHKVAEPYVERLALEHLGAVQYSTTEQGPSTAELEAALEAAEAELTAFVVHVPPTTPGFAEGVAHWQAAADEARQALDDADGDDAWTFLSVSESVERYHRMTREHQRLVIAAAIERVEVSQGRGPVESKVKVTLREVRMPQPPRRDPIPYTPAA